MRFRNGFLDVSGIDPLNYATIASVEMAVFKHNHLVEEFEVRSKDERKRVQVTGGLNDKDQDVHRWR